MEQEPDTTTPLLILAACPVDSRPQGAPLLWGGLTIKVIPDSLAFRIYGASKIEETFTCSYELNPVYRGTLEKTGLKVSGISEDGGARIIELSDHRFLLTIKKFVTSRFILGDKIIVHISNMHSDSI